MSSRKKQRKNLPGAITFIVLSRVEKSGEATNALNLGGEKAKPYLCRLSFFGDKTHGLQI